MHRFTRLCAALSLLVTANAFAITIDDQTPNTSTVQIDGANGQNSGVFTSPGVMGSKRTFFGQVGADPGSVMTLRVFGGKFRHSQDTDTLGRSVITYDGDNSPSLNPQGLGGIDFTADGSTKMTLEDVSSDQPFVLTIYVYDANDPLATPHTFSKTYPAATPATDLTINFTDFSPAYNFKKVGALAIQIDGTAAASLALDVSYAKISTDGTCLVVPTIPGVVDLCGVCNGDNSSCSDCLNVPNGSALPGTSCNTGDLGICATSTWTGTPPRNCQCPDITPRSETCNGMDDNCDGQTDNVPGVNDSCSAGVGSCRRTGQQICGPGGLVCNAVPGTPTSEVCDGADNNCNGATDEGLGLGDRCTVGTGACANPGTKVCDASGGVTCAGTAGAASPEICDGIDNDCDGQTDEEFGLGDRCTAGVGQCGVTGVRACGPGGGVVCVGTPGTPSTEVCDGIDNNCDGVVDEGFNVGLECSTGVGACKSSGALVCNPSGQAECAAPPKLPTAEICDQVDNDCDGVVDNGVVDRCGVCGGDGTACLECTSVDITEKLFALDGGAKDQEQLIIRAVQLLKVTPGSKSLRKYMKSTLETAHVLQIKNWVLSWTLPQVSTKCDNLNFCVTTSNVPKLDEYRAGNDELLNLGLDVIQKIQSLRTGPLRGKELSLQKRILKQAKKNEELANSVPASQTACT